jgi:hypothetical protein
MFWNDSPLIACELFQLLNSWSKAAVYLICSCSRLKPLLCKPVDLYLTSPSFNPWIILDPSCVILTSSKVRHKSHWLGYLLYKAFPYKAKWWIQILLLVSTWYTFGACTMT